MVTGMSGLPLASYCVGSGFGVDMMSRCLTALRSASVQPDLSSLYLQISGTVKLVDGFIKKEDK